MRSAILSTTLCIAMAAIVAFSSGVAMADIVVIEAARDNTLIEKADGSKSNGSGPGIFVGRTSQPSGSIRRAVLDFIVANHVPAGATILSAELHLHIQLGNSDPSLITPHRVLANWGEGASSFNGGSGAPSVAPDTTWIHRFYDGLFWSQPGGDFSATASGSMTSHVASEVTWSSATMAADVQQWLDDPANEHGWLLLGDESTASTALQFASREFGTLAERPTLVVEYATPVPGPGNWLVLGLVAAVLWVTRGVGSIAA